MTSKYIIHEEMGLELPVVFCPVINHIQMRNSFPNIVSAGSCSLRDGKWHCFGKSVFLGLESRPEIDSEILNTNLQRDI